MARRPRLAVAGELHHLLLRGHNGCDVFGDDTDRAAFVELLREPAARRGVAIHAYALVNAEIHLLATPTETESLGRLMQSIGRRYVSHYNRRHARCGTLWDGRFRNSIVDSSLLLPATLHIETLPVRAGLVASAPDWSWSSAVHHVGHHRDPLVTDHVLYWQLGNTPFERERAHTVALHEAQQGDPDPRWNDAVLRSLVVGPVGFVDRVADLLGRPVAPGRRGRPPGASGLKSVPN